jgi:cytochrome oxidase Cu insertion factor (SCO1/SenC/PrrC family)
MKTRAVASAWLLAACGLCGLATAASQAATDKAMKKISKAIGEEIGDFTVTAQEAVDGPREVP